VSEVDEKFMSLTDQLLKAFGPNVRMMYLTVDGGTIGRNYLLDRDPFNFHEWALRNSGQRRRS
jgi:hypothetical protein